MRFEFDVANGTTPRVADRVRILAIDDSEGFRQLLKTVLDPERFEVFTMSSAVKALELFARKKTDFDLVLLDYFMPHMDGAKTLEWLRKLNPDIKIIICSNADELLLRGIAAESHADGYIHKPLNVKELAGQVQACAQKLGLFH
jgi:two-component system, cell cycle sensor histidine kinase and response regulator CckA